VQLLAAIIHEENSQPQVLRAEWYLGRYGPENATFG
jgi:hypothetical protein